MIGRIKRYGVHPFGETLQELRMSKGLSIKDLSELSGLTCASISRYENGLRSPTIETYNKILTALGAELVVID